MSILPTEKELHVELTSLDLFRIVPESGTALAAAYVSTQPVDFSQEPTVHERNSTWCPWRSHICSSRPPYTVIACNQHITKTSFMNLAAVWVLRTPHLVFNDSCSECSQQRYRMDWPKARSKLGKLQLQETKQVAQVEELRKQVAWLLVTSDRKSHLQHHPTRATPLPPHLQPG